MTGIPLLRDLVVLIAVAIPVVILATRLRVPTVVGFLLTGVAIGPHALALIDDPESVAKLAEVGVVLLLFAVGLELSLSRIVRMGRLVLRGGGAQVLLTIALVALAAMALGIPLNKAILTGALVALSSTAVVLKLYADRGELDAPHGRIAVAMLLFQDLCVVPLMLLLPILAGAGGTLGDTLRTFAISMGVSAVLVLGGRYVVPRILTRVVALRNQEIFTLCVVALGLGAAYLTSSVGLSLALGAFLAGLIIAESEYGLQALADILPFRDTFSGIFFTSVGMLLDVRYLFSHFLLVIGATIAIIVIKTLVVVIVVRWVRRSWRVGLIGGLGLAQIGEFSFILAGTALSLGLLDGDAYQLFLGASVITMLATPFAMDLAPAFAERVLRRRAMPTMEFTTREARATDLKFDHVIIVGYGLNGRNLARALKSAGIPYVILEENGSAVRRARLEREPMFFGDGTRAEVLDRVGIRRAKVIVFAIASVAEERRGVAVARHLNPNIHIVARTRYVAEMDELERLGANEVVPEEFETSLEIFARVLRTYDVPDRRIQEAAEEARSDHYELLRERGANAIRIDDTLSTVGSRLSLETLRVEKGAPAIGESAESLDLRKTTGATLVAVIRDGTARYTPDPEFRFASRDEVVLVGDTAALEKGASLFRAAKHSEIA